MKKTIQDNFLGTLQKSQASVAIYLRHGIKLKGNIVGYDEKVIFLQDSEKKIELVFIDSVSTVVAAPVLIPPV